MSDHETVQLLGDIKKILVVICLSNIRNLKRELLTTELDAQVYDACRNKSISEIAHIIPELGYQGIYNRLSEWERQGLVVSKEKASGRGRPKKYFIKVEEYLH